MLALILAAGLAAADPSQTAAPATNPGAPVREIQYKVSYTRHERLTQEQFGGDVPPQQGADASDDGTLTVDVMAVANNSLGVRLTEAWNAIRKPFTYAGTIGPDGSLNFGGQPLNEATVDLLPFFGPLWANGQTLDVGTKWTVKYADPSVDVSTTYEVSKVDASGVTVQESQTVKVTSARGMSGFTTGTILYKPSLLVPISGKLERRSGSGDAGSSDTETMVVNFTRTSDTLDTGK